MICDLIPQDSNFTDNNQTLLFYIIYTLTAHSASGTVLNRPDGCCRLEIGTDQVFPTPVMDSIMTVVDQLDVRCPTVIHGPSTQT